MPDDGYQRSLIFQWRVVEGRMSFPTAAKSGDPKWLGVKVNYRAELSSNWSELYACCLFLWNWKSSSP